MRNVTPKDVANVLVILFEMRPSEVARGMREYWEEVLRDGSPRPDLQAEARAYVAASRIAEESYLEAERQIAQQGH